ncbi:MAG: 6,7-dimethyl-8-ribityllumazine synthase [Flavipsychrobacter sp.]
MKQEHSINNVPNIKNANVCILQSKWYKEQTDCMTKKCIDVLKMADANINTYIVPGCLEFALAAQSLLNVKQYDAIICIGVLMKGDTDHYDMILQSCVIGMQNVSLASETPLINAILPVSSVEQAVERASDNNFNKGIEAAIAAAEFIQWRRDAIG